MTASARAASIRDGVDVLATQAGEFASGLAGPPWLTKLRRDCVAAFVKAGFPSLHDEEWRYTNLLPLARTVFGLAPRDVTIAERTQAVELAHDRVRTGRHAYTMPQPCKVLANYCAGGGNRRASHRRPKSPSRRARTTRCRCRQSPEIGCAPRLHAYDHDTRVSAANVAGRNLAR